MAVKDALKLRVPDTRFQLLTGTSKMPSPSWSIPAIKSCPGAFFGENAICGASKEHTTCYATRAMYRYNTVKLAQAARYDWTLKCLTSDLGFATFVETLIKAITTTELPVFRVHDSGDMFNARYIKAWYAIAHAMPNVRFWIPTRSWRLPNLLPHLIRLNSLPNVEVKPSALVIGDNVPVVEGLGGGTGAKREGYNCPASQQNNQCGECRNCWDKGKVVFYHLH